MADLQYLLVAGYARLPQSTSAGAVYQHLTIIAKVSTSTSSILDVSTTLATALGDAFVKENLIGLNISHELPDFLKIVENHYWGHGRKAIIGAVRDMAKRYREGALVGQP